MKRALSVLLVAARAALAILIMSGVASADPVKMVGVIQQIQLAGKDAKTATVTLKDTKSDKQVDITIQDELTLDKLKDHRMQDGDEIRCKYEVKDGKNVASSFLKTAGC